MHRLTVLCCVLLVAVLNASCAQATEPSTTTRGPVWAYGTEVPGDAWFEERAGVSYYQGTHQYWPRAPRSAEPVPAAVPDAALTARQILGEASVSARAATTADDWAERYTRVLSAHPDDVLSFTRIERGIVIAFAGVPFPHVIACPVNPPRTGRISVNPDSIRQDQVDRFWKFYNNGSWICWGSDYFTVVHPVWHAKMIAAIDRIATLKASGLRGDALTRAIGDIDLKNTALEEDNFLRDLIAIEGR